MKIGSVFLRDVPKQIGHGLSVINPSNCLRQEDADVNGLDLATLLFVLVMGNGIGHQDLRGEKEERHISHL